MEKRSLIAIGLAAVVILVWYWLFPPAPPQPPAPPPTVEQGTAAGEPEGPATPAEVPPAPAPPPTEATASANEEKIDFENDVIRVSLTNRGGRVVSWKLKEYRDSAGEPIELVPEFAERTGLLPLALDLPDADLAAKLNGALYRVERERVAEGAPSPGERIRFSWSDGQGLSAEKSLVLPEEGYLARLDVKVVDRGRRLPARLTWGPGFEARDPKRGAGQLHYTGQAVWNLGGAVSRASRAKQEISVPGAGRLRWAGIEEQFFAALILPASGRGDAVVRGVSVPPPGGAQAEGAETKPATRLVVAVGIPEEGAELYVGPKKYTLLERLGRDLGSVVWFSSYSLIYWLAKYLFLALLWLHDHLVANYGLAIIVATVVLRLVFFPLNQHSMVSMRKMQVQMQRIQPKINAIKQKYRKNKDTQSRGKMNEEMMALYKKEGVNPMGGMSGCLPMLVQFPILIAFYNVLTVAVELRAAPFIGWIRDLTAKDPFYVTPLLMGATMFLQQKMTATKGGDPMQQRMMLMMPVVFTIMFLNLPSGLVLYWFVNNLLGIAQQWLVNRHISRLEADAKKA